MTISTDDQNRYRGGLHSTKTIVNRVPKIIAATAQINQPTFTYPIASLTFDGLTTFHTVKAGYMFMVGTTPGAWDVTVGVVKGITGTVLSIDAKSQGDPGYARSIITPLADNHYITILKYRPPFGLLSSIRAGVFYKNWNLPYKGEGINPSPVPVFGGWRQVFCETGGTVTIPLSSTESWAWGGRSIFGRVWNLDGGSVVTGTLTSSSLTAEFEPGFYELECRVTDNRFGARTGYRYLWVNVDDPADDNAPFNYRNPCKIIDDKREIKGRELALQFDKNLTDIDELFPAQGFLVTEFPDFNGESLDGDSFVANFAGYQTEGSKLTNYKKRQTTLTLKSPVAMAELIPAAVQEMNEVPNPATWAEVGQVLSNPVGAVWYIAAHHAPYLIDGHDFELNPDLLALRRQTFQFKSTNIAGQLKTVSDMGLCLIGNKSNGRLRMVRNPMYMSLDDRNALATEWTYAPGDIAGELTRAFYTRNNTGQVYGYAFSYDGSGTSTPYQSLAPGYVRSQADGQANMTPFIVAHAGGQDRVNAITGHEFARSNKAPNYTLVSDRNLDFIEPIDADKWYNLNVPASYDSEWFGWINERAIPVKVSCSWDYSGGIKKTLSTEFEPESYGVPGVTIPVDRGGGNNWWLTDWNPGLFDIYSPVMPDLGLTLPVMLAINSYGNLARTSSFAKPKVSWQRLAGFAGLPISFSLDFNSPYFSDSSQALNVILLTRESTALHVYRFNALATNPVFNEFTNSPITASTAGLKSAKVKISRTTADLVLVAWRELDGVYYSRSTSSTPTLSAKAHVGATLASDSAQLAEPLGMDIEGSIQAVIAPDGSTTLDGKNAYKLYVATGTGSFSPLTGNPLSDESAALGFVALDTDAYVSYLIPDPPTPAPDLGVVTFDAGGQTGYTIQGVGEITGGNPDDAAYNSFNADGAGGSVAVSVTCTFPAAKYNITDIEFDGKQVVTGSITDVVNGFKVECFAGGRSVGVGVPTLREDYGTGWRRYGIRSDELRLSEAPEIVKVTYGYSFADSSPTTIVYAYVDNIIVTGTPIDFSGTRTLYRVNVGSDLWDDVTPAGKELGLLPYSLGSFAADPNLILLSGTSDNGKLYLLNSNGGGSSWSTIGRTPYAALARSGSNVLGWGVNAIGLSADAGITFYPRLGDWAAKVGAIGEFLVVGGIL